jgi:hypothetical protein
MVKFDFQIGAPVKCTDGDCGKLLKIVVDPETQQSNGLVVEQGLLVKTRRVVSIVHVERASKDAVQLSICSEELDTYPEYQMEKVRLPTDGWEQANWRSRNYSLGNVLEGEQAIERPVVPMVRHVIHTGISPEHVVVERGMPVENIEGQIGRLDHVLVDPLDLQISHLVIDPGMLSPLLVMPISMLTGISQDSIQVEASKRELEKLPQYTPRDSADVLAELQESLAADPSAYGDVRAAFNNGVLRLVGIVPDTLAKRQVEAAARSLPGVIEVDNALRTDQSIVAHVTAALSTDPRTDVAVVGVVNERGVVTLKGRVDDPNTREAAERIARRQPGVVDVINDLEVGIDDVSEILRFRMMLLGQGEPKPHRGAGAIDD